MNEIKTKELNKLFDEWETSIDNYKDSFKRDGINDETKFGKNIPKILFITKEPNDPKQEDGDYRVWWENKIKYSFSHRIAEWSYGILNDFKPTYDSFKKNDEALLNALHSVAFMNLKKTGGKGTSKEHEILEHLVQQQLDFIHKEIKIIKPEIIITGLSWNSVRAKLFGDIIWKNSGYSVAIGKFNEAKVIDFYHPSSRTAPAASYSLLENIIKSKSFKEL